MSYQVDENGFYGEFGGAYIPEILYKCVDELRKAYLPVIESEEFKQEFRRLRRSSRARSSSRNSAACCRTMPAGLRPCIMPSA